MCLSVGDSHHVALARVLVDMKKHVVQNALAAMRVTSCEQPGSIWCMHHSTGNVPMDLLLALDFNGNN